MKYSQKLLISLLAICLLPLMIFAVFVRREISHSTVQAVEENLSLQLWNRSRIIEDFFAMADQIMHPLGENPTTIAAMAKLSRAVNDYAKGLAQAGISEAAQKSAVLKHLETEFAQEYQKQTGISTKMQNYVDQMDSIHIAMMYGYYVTNPNPLGKKQNFSESKFKTAYDELHHSLHHYMSQVLEMYELYDIFLIDLQGRVVYTTFKEIDFGADLVKGPLKNSALAKSFNSIKATTDDSVRFHDFESYYPSYEAPAAFFASKIHDDNEVLYGFVIVQAPIGKLGRSIATTTGLGESGEAYIIGSDKLLRTNLRHKFQWNISNSYLNPKASRLQSDVLDLVQNQNQKKGLAKNRDQKPVFFAADSHSYDGATWYAIIELDEDEGLLSLRSLIQTAWWLILAMAVLALFISYRLVKSMQEPLELSIGLANEIALGHFDKRLRLQRQDEFGQLCASLDSMAESLANIAKIAEEVAKGDISNQIRLASESDQLGNSLQRMSDNLNDILNSARESAGTVASASTDVSDSCIRLSTASNEQAAALEEVAATVTQMDAQAKSNSDLAHKGIELGNEVQQYCESSQKQMLGAASTLDELNQASSKVSNIVRLIEDIAFQTNLLSLNASIEAARAGHHGKGFAVVADEVRLLSKRSSDASAEIEQLINTMVSKIHLGADQANKAANSQKEVMAKVAHTNEFLTQVATLSKQQANATAQIDHALAQMNTITLQNTSTAEKLSRAAEGMQHRAEILQKQLSHFRLKSDSQLMTNQLEHRRNN